LAFITYLPLLNKIDGVTGRDNTLLSKNTNMLQKTIIQRKRKGIILFVYYRKKTQRIYNKQLQQELTLRDR